MKSTVTRRTEVMSDQMKVVAQELHRLHSYAQTCSTTDGNTISGTASTIKSEILKIHTMLVSIIIQNNFAE